MLNDLFNWLLATFVFVPVQAEIEERVRQAGLSAEVVHQVRRCITDATPALVRRAGDDWLWGATTVIGVATGSKDPLDVVATGAPSCKGPIDAIRRAPGSTAAGLSPLSWSAEASTAHGAEVDRRHG